jgi:hypothetical protein
MFIQRTHYLEDLWDGHLVAIYIITNGRQKVGKMIVSAINPNKEFPIKILIIHYSKGIGIYVEGFLRNEFIPDDYLTEFEGMAALVLGKNNLSEFSRILPDIFVSGRLQVHDIEGNLLLDDNW